MMNDKIQEVNPFVYTEEWEHKAGKLALSVVNIHPCKTCQQPVLSRHKCTFCGEVDPLGGRSVAEVIGILIKNHGLLDVLATIGFVIEVDQKNKTGH